MRRLKPASVTDVDDVREALQYLRMARDFLKSAGCPNALDRVRLAITSAGGALRHAERREMISNSCHGDTP